MSLLNDFLTYVLGDGYTSMTKVAAYGSAINRLHEATDPVGTLNQILANLDSKQDVKELANWLHNCANRHKLSNNAYLYSQYKGWAEQVDKIANNM